MGRSVYVLVSAVLPVVAESWTLGVEEEAVSSRLSAVVTSEEKGSVLVVFVLCVAASLLVCVTSDDMDGVGECVVLSVRLSVDELTV